jgi:hypothetical protein
MLSRPLHLQVGRSQPPSHQLGDGRAARMVRRVTGETSAVTLSSSKGTIVARCPRSWREPGHRAMRLARSFGWHPPRPYARWPQGDPSRSKTPRCDPGGDIDAWPQCWVCVCVCVCLLGTDGPNRVSAWDVFAVARSLLVLCFPYNQPQFPSFLLASLPLRIRRRARLLPALATALPPPRRPRMPLPSCRGAPARSRPSTWRDTLRHLAWAVFVSSFSWPCSPACTSLRWPRTWRPRSTGSRAGACASRWPGHAPRAMRPFPRSTNASSIASCESPMLMAPAWATRQMGRPTRRTRCAGRSEVAEMLTRQALRAQRGTAQGGMKPAWSPKIENPVWKHPLDDPRFSPRS